MNLDNEKCPHYNCDGKLIPTILTNVCKLNNGDTIITPNILRYVCDVCKDSIWPCEEIRKIELNVMLKYPDYYKGSRGPRRKK